MDSIIYALRFRIVKGALQNMPYRNGVFGPREENKGHYSETRVRVEGILLMTEVSSRRPDQRISGWEQKRGCSGLYEDVIRRPLILLW